MGSVEDLLSWGVFLRFAAIGTYAAAFVSYASRLAVQKLKLDRIATGFAALGVSAHTAYLVTRWIAAGQIEIIAGWPLLTIGIVMGGMWANEAWGRFWGWDPKETWALITWVVYAGYLHTRITLGWAGKRPAAIAVFAFAVVVFTFMGVNLGLTGEGLHTYGAG